MNKIETIMVSFCGLFKLIFFDKLLPLSFFIYVTQLLLDF